jgi:Bacterial SH3 domain
MSLVRVAAPVAIFTLLSAACAVAKPIATTGETNLRKSPGTDSEVLTLIPKGTTVEVGKCTNGWCEASLDGKDGYVIARNVGMAPRRPPRGPMAGDEMVENVGPPVYGPRPAYVVGPPVYYGYGPYYRPYGYYGWGWGGWGWGRRW